MRTRRKVEKKAPVKRIGGYGGRIHFVAFIMAFFLVLCLGKVGYLQLVKGRELLEEVRGQVEDSIPFFAKRGKILDREGNVLAMTVETKGIEVCRKEVRHPEYVVDYIAGTLAIPRERAQKLANCKGSYCYVERFVDPKIAEPLEAILAYRGKDAQILWQQEMLTGIRVVKAAGRLYPYGENAGQVVGVARVPQGNPGDAIPSPMKLQGQYGLEAACDELLSGKSVVQKGVKRQQQGMSLLPNNPELVLEGNSVVLTLDVNIQAIAEEELRRTVLTSLARRGIAVVAEVATGELLAVAHYPPFNPNGTSSYSGDEIWKWNDSAFIEIFEPGSILKPVVIASALEEGVVGMEDQIFCENGSWKIEKREKPIKDHGRFGFLNVWDIIKFSSNIGSGKVGLRLGQEKLQSYLQEFGFGERSGAMPSGREARGILRRGKRGWSDMEIANISFGQGIAVTAIQMVNSIATLGNGGTRMKPLLVKEVIDANGETISRAEPEVMGQPVSPEVARLAVDGMRRVLESGGTGEAAKVYGFDAAGKTGTAQKTMTVEDPNWLPGGERKRPRRRGVYVDKWVGSFVGLVPATTPRLAILVMVDEPYMNDFGGVVAAPAFSHIASRSLAYMNVIPSQEIRHSVADRSDNHAADSGKKEAAADEAIPAVELQNVGPAVVPNLSGMTVGEALKTAVQSRVKLEANGAGMVVHQEPSAATVVDEWATVRVDFAASVPAVAEEGE
jgi:cell division protein FtsI (penicillin-binding protein 3)